MDQKFVLFTFDYELFLGDKSGSVYDCLIRPTAYLIRLFDKYKKKAIFFVDTTYLIRLKDIANNHPNAKNDFDLIAKQLIELALQGHSIFHHIHPHWLDAKYNEITNEWSLKDFTKYRFASINKEQRDFLFEESIKLLNEIIKPVVQDYLINGYRAGGWSIQPFSDFKPYFDKYGIVNDFSVIPGKCNISTAHLFDFRNIPSKNIYRFSDDVGIESEDGPYKEFTISYITLSKMMIWLNFKISGLLKRLQIKPFGKGTTVKSVIIKEECAQRSNDKRIIASFEGLTFITVFKYLKKIKQTGYFQFISHPKLITGHELWLLNILFFKLRKKNIETDFKKIPGNF